MSTNYINFRKFAEAELKSIPFEYAVVENFIIPDIVESVIEDFPIIESSGSFPLDSVNSGEHFQSFIEELKGEKFRKEVEKKFNINLDNRPVMITARGQCVNNNGQIHRDSEGKLVTILIYLNKSWDREGGKLRLLNNNHDLEDYVAEISPLAGSLVIFKCEKNAWHGHKPYSGPRNSIQLNWVIDNSYLGKERIRHRFSAWCKKKIKTFKNFLS